MAEADPVIIATLIQRDRVSQGNCPSTLDQARLPELLAILVAEQKIAYRQKEEAFAWD